MKLIGDVNFDVSYSFIFSARPGTPAADMVDDVPEEEKKQRLYILQERINQQADGLEPSYARHRPAHPGGRHLA